MNKASLSIGVVEDNDDLRDSLVEALNSHGYNVVGVDSAEQLREVLCTRSLSLLVLDLNLPGEDGLSIAVRLKRSQPLLRVIMLTTRTSLPERLVGYESGADLYLSKPVDQLELIAAVHAMARQIANERSYILETQGDKLQLHPLNLSLQGPKGIVYLSSREFKLLIALVNAPNQSLEHWELLDILGLEMDTSGKSTLAVFVTRLRNKMLWAGCKAPALKAMRSLGYHLCSPLEIVNIIESVTRPSIDVSEKHNRS